MGNHSAIGRARGVMAVRADARGPDQGALNAVLGELNSTFTNFRARNEGRLDALETAVNSQRETIDALRIGPGAGDAIHPGAGIRGNRRDAPVLSAGIANEFRAVLKGDQPYASMSTQSGPDGGFTVVPEVDRTIEAQLRDFSPLRQLARVVSLGSGSGTWEKIIARPGAQSSWVGEEEARPENGSPKVGKVSIGADEVCAIPEVTNWLLDDSAFDIASFLDEEVAGEFSLTESGAFVTGDGVKKPRGFLTVPVAATADSARAFGTLQYVPSGDASAFVAATSSVSPADCLHDLLTALRPSYRKGDGVAWLMNSTTANTVRKFKDGQGNFLWTNSLMAGQPDRLLGYPVAIDEGMPDVEAGSFPIAFGNWRRGYAIVDKPGVRLIVDKVTKKGWTKFYFYKRVGGGVVDSNAIKLLKIATT